jgi:hypothetical protein
MFDDDPIDTRTVRPGRVVREFADTLPAGDDIRGELGPNPHGECPTGAIEQCPFDLETRRRGP